VGVPAPGDGGAGELRRAHREYVDEDGRERDPLDRRPGTSSACPTTTWSPATSNGVVNTLRLWSARATQAFDLHIFNAGDYAEAVRAQTFAENISKVLYPEDSTPQGKELRLQQQYFFVACSIKDFIQTDHAQGLRPARPARADHLPAQRHPPGHRIPELMRILVDEHGLDWDEAWASPAVLRLHLPHPAARGAGGLAGRPCWSGCCRGTWRSSTGSTTTSSPRCARPTRATSCASGACRSSQEHPERAVRMAHLATVAAVKVNGVAALHSQLLREKVLNDFSEMWPEQVHQCHQRRDAAPLHQAGQPELSKLITDTIGVKGWVTDLDRLRGTRAVRRRPGLPRAFAAVKLAEQVRGSRKVLSVPGRHRAPRGPMLDVMVKRLHEYKRQSLKLLHIVTLYERIISGEVDGLGGGHAAHLVFGAKAAPGYGWPRRSSADQRGRPRRSTTTRAWRAAPSSSRRTTT
jgi:starch phosphorylase